MRISALVSGLLGGLVAALGFLILIGFTLGDLPSVKELTRGPADEYLREFARFHETYGSLERVPSEPLESFARQGQELFEPLMNELLRLLPPLGLGLLFSLIGLIGAALTWDRPRQGARIILVAAGALAASALWMSAAGDPPIALRLLSVFPGLLLLAGAAALSLLRWSATGRV